MPARRPSRLNRTTKWACTILAGVMVVAWVGSVWYWAFWSHRASAPRFNLVLSRGAITGQVGCWPSDLMPSVANQFDGPYSNAGPITPMDERWHWTPRFESVPSFTGDTFPANITLPLWIPTLLFTLPAAWMWRTDFRRRRIARAGGCTNCGYSLVATPAEKPCPECGTART